GHVTWIVRWSVPLYPNPYPAQANRHARIEAEFPGLRISGQIGRNCYRGKERLTIGKRLAVACQNSLDHRLLREMREHSLAERFCTRQPGVGIVERCLDRVRHRTGAVGGEQPVG